MGGLVVGDRIWNTESLEPARLTVLLLIIALLWMGPRFIGSFHIIISSLTALPILITVFHAVIGTSALLAGIFLGFDIVTYIVRYILTPLTPR